ncbi:glycoprotein A33 (transmembrane), paralog a [Megalops cyprinoides]|uniref:glycoprotein A33 (transmembrane), paralog a n=1 Tax=Megalops cyprinoides TaxID=118141 RepID=UPI0018647AF3|nr:glycoprotein A33 (transmembrane), paralog a [Megalops cyprinoides]
MKFECDVKIPGDDEGKTLATTRLVVLVAPSKPMCKIQGTAEYGQNINLTCVSAEGSPQPTYSWQRHNVQNIPQPLPAKATDKNGLLSLYNVSMETSGYYICTSRNKIRSEICNLTLTVMPPSMNIGSTAGIIGGSVAALLVLLIVIYCCCCRKKEQPEEYGVPEEVAFTDKEPIQKQGDPRDDRSERSYDRRDRREEGSEVNGSTIDRRERYDDRGSDYSDRRDRYDDRRDRYDDRRDRYDDRRDDYDDHRERYDDRRDRYDDRRDDYDDRSERYDDRDRPPSVPPNKPKRTDYD